MRSRILKPEFFRDVKVLGLDPLNRLLFAGLWCLADREGRLSDEPGQIKIDVIPVDDLDVDSALDCIQRAGLITRYAVDGRQFIQVVNFLRHQNPHVRESASTVPAPGQHCAKHDLGSARHGLGEGEASPRSPISISISDSVSVDASPNGEASARPRKLRRPVSARRTPEEIATHEPILFGKLWAFFGKHGSCEKAAREWDALAPSRDEMKIIRAAIENQRAAYRWGQEGGQTQPHLSTWLHGRNWEWDAVPNKIARGE